MRLAQDSTPHTHVIRAYSAGELRINDTTYRSSVILGATQLEPQAALARVEDLRSAHRELVMSMQPEIVLLGTGARQVFPAPEFGAALLDRGIGFEVMDTGAACRTFNVLIGEQRRVVAVLLVS